VAAAGGAAATLEAIGAGAAGVESGAPISTLSINSLNDSVALSAVARCYLLRLMCLESRRLGGVKSH
jgi:hypothetical protein